MSVVKMIRSEPKRTVGVELLRAVHLWSGRQYRRAMLRGMLKRIGREMAAERKARERAGRRRLEKVRAGLAGKAGIRRLGTWCRGVAKSRAI